MKKTLSELFAIALACLCLSSCTSTTDAFLADDMFFVDVTVVDVSNGTLSANQTIIVRDQKILDIKPTEQVRPPSERQILVKNGYAVPGLWDMHVHSMSDPELAFSYYFPLLLANGVTGVRDMGSVVEGIVETRTRLNANPSLLAPHLYVSGPLLDGQKLPWYGDLPLVLTSAEDVARELPKLQAAGMDFLKVYDGLPREAYDAVIAYGQENGLPIAGHIPKSISIKEASSAGQKTVEHLSPFGLTDCLAEPGRWFQRAINAKFGEGYPAYFDVTDSAFAALDKDACRDVFDTLAQNNTYLTPTLVMEMNDRSRVPAKDLVYLQPAGRDWCQTGLDGIEQVSPELRTKVFSNYGGLASDAKAAGIRLLAGSDTPNNCLVPGFSLHWELMRLTEANLSPLEVLQSATIHAAAALDKSDQVGRLAPGFSADVLILNANPLDGVSNLRDLKGVMSQGRWIDNQMRQELLASVLSSFETASLDDVDQP